MTPNTPTVDMPSWLSWARTCCEAHVLALTPPTHLTIPLARCCRGEGCRVSGPKPAGSERVSSPSTRQSGCSTPSLLCPPLPPAFLSDSGPLTLRWKLLITDHFILLIVVLFNLSYCTFIYLFLDHFAIGAPWVREDWNVIYAVCLACLAYLT